MYRKAAVKHSFKVFSENLKTGNIDKIIGMENGNYLIVDKNLVSEVLVFDSVRSSPVTNKSPSIIFY